MLPRFRRQTSVESLLPFLGPPAHVVDFAALNVYVTWGFIVWQQRHERRRFLQCVVGCVSRF